MNESSRRNFLQKSTLVALGTTASISGLAFGETTAESDLKVVDRKLADLLRTYGRARKMKSNGFEKAKVGSKTVQLPISQVSVEVKDQGAFVQSFEKIADFSERVFVEGNKVSFASGDRYFVIDNHVA